MTADLIAKLEAATEPSRELADEVLLACGWSYNQFNGYWYPTKEHMKHHAEPRYLFDRQPNPLTSIDAALTLVLGGMDWVIGGGSKQGAACINGGCVEVAATPAIAICVAILKAKTALGDE